MREIKFRAWDTQLKKMVPRNVIPIFNDAYVTAGGYGENVVVSKLRQGTLMQYTGLKDKNGKEIYEGDMVKILYIDWSSQDNYNVLQVVYEAPSFELMNPGHTLFDINPGTHGWIEVIGNIYENPELTAPKQKES